MARINSIGFELNSMTAGVEITNSFSANATIQTSIVRSGTYALKCDNTAHNDRISPFYRFASSGQNGPIYVRDYIYIGTAPAVTVTILGLNFNADDTTSSHQAVIKMTSTRTLQLFYSLAGVLTQIGSDSAALNTGQWYCIELWFDHSPAGGSQVVKARIDQATEFASASNLTIQNTVQTLVFGTNIIADVTDNASVIYHDDIAINDSTGSSQTTYPGAGQIIHLRPSAAGDNNAFTVQVGGTAGSSNNFTRVNEVTPDDATTYNGDVTATNTDDFNIDDTPSSIASGDTINVVQVGVRFASLIAAAEAEFKVRVKKAASGTVSSSAGITPNSATWKTNAIAEPNTYPVILYQDPDASAWTKATLDTAQIGYNISTTNTNAVDISTVWMLVDSTPVPVTVTAATLGWMPLLGVGRSR